MTISNFGKLLLLGALVFPLLVPAPAAMADGMRTRTRVVHHRHVGYRLPPERHVLEGMRPPGSNVFLINGRYFTAASPSCARWLPNDPIKLVAGDWNGYCETAVFRNLRRGSSCTMYCR